MRKKLLPIVVVVVVFSRLQIGTATGVSSEHINDAQFKEKHPDETEQTLEDVTEKPVERNVSKEHRNYDLFEKDNEGETKESFEDEKTEYAEKNVSREHRNYDLFKKDNEGETKESFEDEKTEYAEKNSTAFDIVDDEGSFKQRDNATRNAEPTKLILKKSDEDQDDITCDSPPKIEGTLPPKLVVTRSAIGTVVIYRCNFGYVSQDSRGFRSVCKLDSPSGRANWTNPNVSCIPRSCGDPGFVPNAYQIGSLFTFPNKVEYQCQEGYRMKGSPSRYCQASGTWSGRLPTCEQIYCDRPVNPEHGRVQYNSLEYGEELRYDCDKGFVLGQHKKRTCTENGTWSDNDPVCIESSCEMPPSPEHGSMLLEGTPKVGSVVMYSCNDGRTLIGASASKCLVTGEWTFPPPKCKRSCVLPDVSNGALGYTETKRTNRYRTQEMFVKFQVGKIFNHGESAIFRCEYGFAPTSSWQSSEGSSQNVEVVTCEDGQWSHPLECKQMSCFGEPLPIDNGYPVVNDISHGFTIYYRCETYYVKTADGKVTCVYGEWTGKTPVCSDGRCFIAELNYPGIERPQMEFIEDGKTLPVSCRKGFKVFNVWTKVSCNIGKWEIPERTCVEENCSEPPDILHGRFLNKSRDHNSKVEYKCDPGYELIGHSTVQCQYGEWEGRPPDCVGADEIPPNMSTTSSSNAEKRISGEPESCVCTYYPADTLLVAVVNRTRLENGGSIRKGETVFFFCDADNRHLLWPNGMRMYQSAPLTCDVCQTWRSSELPSCDRTQLGDSFIEMKETMKIRPGGSVEYQRRKQLKIACVNFGDVYPDWYSNTEVQPGVNYDTEIRSNYRKYISFLIIPELIRKYTGSYTCSTRNYYQQKLRPTKLELRIQDITCREIEGTKLMWISYTNSQRIGSYADFHCMSPRIRVGVARTLCLENGEWKDPEPTCQTITCDLPPKINGTLPLQLGNSRPLVGTVVTYRCDYGYITYGSGKFSSVCEFDEHTRKAHWTEPIVSCIPNPVKSVSEEQKSTSVDSYGKVAPISPASKEPDLEEDITCIYNNADRKLSALVKGIRLWYGDRVKKGDSVQLICVDQAMQLVMPNGTKVQSGIAKLTCNYRETWEAIHLPTCEALHPVITTCPMLSPTGSITVKYSNQRKVGSTATFSCRTPRLLVGQSTLWCLQSGNWSNLIPTCKNPEVRCPLIEETEIFTVNFTNRIKINSTAHFRCKDANLKIAGGLDTRICLPSGEWSGTYPECEDPEVRCPLIQETEVFTVNFSNHRRINSTAHFHCKDANLKIAGGLDTRTCLPSGEWSGTYPECEADGCLIGDFFETAPQNLLPKVEDDTKELQPIGSELSLQCEAGEVPIGDKKVKCGPLGKWEFGNVRCVPGCHLNIDDGSLIIIDPRQEHFRLGESAALSCPDGLELASSVQKVMCMGSSWTDTIPDCQKKAEE